SNRLFVFLSRIWNTTHFSTWICAMCLGGLGYHAIKRPNTTFDVFGGGSFDQEYFAAYNLVTPNPTPPHPTISTAQPAVTRKRRKIMGFITWMVVGLIAGWLAGQVMKGGGYGILMDIILGILGGLVGGWVFGLLGLHASGLLGTIIVSFVGAVILVWISRLVKKK